MNVLRVVRESEELKSATRREGSLGGRDGIGEAGIMGGRSGVDGSSDMFWEELARHGGVAIKGEGTNGDNFVSKLPFSPIGGVKYPLHGFLMMPLINDSKASKQLDGSINVSNLSEFFDRTEVLLALLCSFNRLVASVGVGAGN